MSMPEQPLGGKVAIVTGAGTGIGKAIAQAYARAGAAVCWAARNATEIGETVQEIVAAGGKALAVPTDVTQREAVQTMVRTTIKAFGGLDILVVNAGIGNPESVEDSDPELWRTTIDVNLMGAYLLCSGRDSCPQTTRVWEDHHRGLGCRASWHGRDVGLCVLQGRLVDAHSRAGPGTGGVSDQRERTHSGASGDESVGSRRASGGTAPGPDSEWVKTPAEVVPLALFLATQPAKGPTAQSFSLMRRDN
jgi:3-oxoacyl-[acyl-carrier protein] reductase